MLIKLTDMKYLLDSFLKIYFMKFNWIYLNSKLRPPGLKHNKKYVKITKAQYTLKYPMK